MTRLNPAEVEQTKLLANALDRTSTACVTVGVVTPIAALLYGIGPTAVQLGLAVLGYFLGWLMIAVFLHYMARRVLRKLR
ncbi:MAG: hypothetical protein KJ947_02005 [Alphaproteobacteria bacterium]|nr:hypothetical protein [Alphaproteobacteria bacterium]MBU1548336.1 hypothetical protein [Alphaproteobacteria bacterium]MBU2335902.1 hypothetical protein [Alphaproteobacteria bacterium]MBU2390703.1 hypothetical protein [Alphaproteobacteria bacterium]